MILSDAEILEMVEKGKLKIEPFRRENVQPSSLDLTLGNSFMVMDDMDSIDVREPVRYRKVVKDVMTIQPHSFVLATTVEKVEIPEDMTAFLEGRSSIGRLGLFIHNAGWVDSGFSGRLTLELYNANSVPIRVHAGMRICQIIFARLGKKAENPYRGKYFGQKDVVGSRIHLDFGGGNA